MKRLLPRTSTTIAGIAFVGIAALALTACSGSGGSSSASHSAKAVTMTTVKIGEVAPFQAANYLTLVAQQEGFFKENGIDAQFIANSGNPIAPLVSGDMDISTVGINGMSALEQGQDIKFIDAFPSQITFSLIVPKDSAAAKDAHKWPTVMKDLKGKTLGVTVPGALVENVAKYLVTKAGLSPSDITVTAAGTGASLVAGLQGGTFQSGLVPSPLFEPLLASGKFVSVLDIFKGEVPGFALPTATPAVTGAYAKAHPGVIAGFQKAIQEANDWARKPSNKSALTTMVAQRLNVDPSTVQAPVQTFIEALGKSTVYTESQWKAALNVLRQNDVITKDYSYSTYVLSSSGN